jgi:heme/copper-type cytochrome/quinol oxidase subunit 1
MALLDGFLGFNGTFLVMHTLGLEGIPRRIVTYRRGVGEEGSLVPPAASTISGSQ